MEQWQDRGNYLFRSEWDNEMKVNRDIYLYKQPQKRQINGKDIVFNRLEVEEDPCGFDNECYTYAFYYMDDQLVATQ